MTRKSEKVNPYHGADTSFNIRIGEASWRGTPYRAHLYFEIPDGGAMIVDRHDHRMTSTVQGPNGPKVVAIDLAYLSLKGARHLLRRLEATVKRLEKVRPGRARRK